MSINQQRNTPKLEIVSGSERKHTHTQLGECLQTEINRAEAGLPYHVLCSNNLLMQSHDLWRSKRNHEIICDLCQKLEIYCQKHTQRWATSRD